MADPDAPSLSVVIPTLNAAAGLPACLAALAEGEDLVGEVLVADGGSSDGTPDLARRHGCRLVETRAGRGRQLAAGAEAAEGDWLLFLHADTRLGEGWADAVRAFVADPANRDRAGVFRLAYDRDTPGARRVARWANRRTRWLGLPYGDQGLLIRRATHDALGGFPDVPLMEDVMLVRQLGRARVRVLDADAVTSGARYERDGWWARPLRNLSILTLHLLGVSPDRLKRLYG
ncbi:transferase 2, rSAM/selenodomain-associated [Limimonas halophila]|uniref:Transferase 2, rSAM/selenodomain-associated n=1 Tax=Limimonas halophila TaxID=1082479 RepID=A0A1G7LSL7_9PROT|nr:TIGR04283 family arsenosugar biosynthesis glycosyltransferase [Limimonas halophila]SDF52548.1 transferase 2, rSAM/selenodomain-associated [Limimonas halophila]